MSRKTLKENNDAIIDEARSRLLDSYIKDVKFKGRNLCGWRNGFKHENGVLPGPTATALGLEFWCKLGKFPSPISCHDIVSSLLATQLRDPLNHNQKTGWEVMSMKQNNSQSVPSIDATATVIQALRYAMITQTFNRETRKKIEDSITAGESWLKKQAESKYWGVHKDDAHRVFVMCNILHALEPLGLDIDYIRIQITDELLKYQKADGGWSATANSAASSEIFHTAKVLNYLETLKIKNNDVEKAIIKGIGFLKRQVRLKTDCCFTTEEVLACNGATKTFYHDHYTEWLRQICYSTRWSSTEFYIILQHFNSVHSFHDGKFYTTVDGNNQEKDQVWLLIPAAIQCISCNEYMINHPPSIFRMLKYRFQCCIVLSAIIALAAMTFKKYDLIGVAVIPFIVNIFSTEISKRFSDYKHRKKAGR